MIKNISLKELEEEYETITKSGEKGYPIYHTNIKDDRKYEYYMISSEDGLKMIQDELNYRKK